MSERDKIKMTMYVREFFSWLQCESPSDSVIDVDVDESLQKYFREFSEDEPK